MHRLFVAIRPPRPIREQLLAIMDGIRGARWQDDGQLHLTLRFIGEVDRHVAEDVASFLNTVAATPFEITLDGVGYFEKNGRRGSVWAGVSPKDGLKALHEKIESAFRRLGLEPDHRAFLPHITIARLNRSSGPIDNFVQDHSSLRSPSFAVEHFELFESFLTESGAHYESVARYPLG